SAHVGKVLAPKNKQIVPSHTMSTLRQTRAFERLSLWAVAALTAGQLACAPTAPATLPSQVPGAPTHVVAALQENNVTVSWTAPMNLGTGGITSYIVTTTPGGTTTTVSGTMTKLVVSNLWPGTYTFSVHAKNTTGNGPESLPSNPVTVPTPGVEPGAPTTVV